MTLNIKTTKESDGICFARRFNECIACIHLQKGCNTYECPFYKPCGCEDWVRLEGKGENNQKVIHMIPPEEYMGQWREEHGED